MVDPARLPAGAGTGIRRALIQSFKEFPPSQKPASFSIGPVMEKLTTAGQKNH
jgi:hypothetical protein